MPLAVACLLLVIPVSGLWAMSLQEIDLAQKEALAPVLEPAQRTQLEQLYAQALASAQAVEGYAARVETYKQAPARRERTRKELLDRIAQMLRLKATPTVSQRERTLDAPALENLQELTRSERATLEGKLASYELRLRTLSSRPAELARERATVAARLAALDGERSTLLEGAGDALSKARTVALDTEYAARQMELEMLNLEQINLGGEEEITGLRRELVLLDLERLSARVTTLGELLIERREAEAATVRESVELAQTGTAELDPALRGVLQETSQLSAELEGLVAAQTDSVRRRGEYAELRQRLNSEFETSRQRLQLSGTSATLGRVLVEKRRRLPRLAQLMAQTRRHAAEATRASLRRIELDERRADIAAFTGEVPDEASRSSEMAERHQKFRELDLAQDSVLGNLDANYAAYLRQLDATDSELQQLIKTVSAYEALLDERLMWIPNALPWSAGTLVELVRSMVGLGGIVPWRQVGGDLRQALIQHPLLALALLVVSLSSLALRPRLRRKLADIARAQGNPETRTARASLTAMALMVFVVLPGPSLLLGLGLPLDAGEGSSGFSGGIARAAITAAVLWLSAAWCSLALSAEGLVGAHFPAEAVAVRRSRRAWRNFARVFVPAYSLAVNFESLGFTTAQDSMARALFLLSMLALLALGVWLVKRDNPFAHASFGLSREPQAFFWRLALLAPPTALLVLSALGYHYTATELSRYYLMSAGLITVAISAYQLTLRWISIAEYRTRCERALEMPETSENTPDEAEYERLNAQARLVMRNVIGWSLALGLLAVWQTVLPALTVLEHVTLWEIAVTDAEGGARSQPVTIANLLLALVTALVALIASWNLPGVIEIGLLQRLRMKQGSRYALTSLLQYAIVALGLSLALSTLGMRWSQVQWLVAALGVGLGFGLQEIFANFISGLILLFERPIRVGDFVTIGDLSGRVIRIRIRATTLRDVDNKELIVPNKNFITERFSNWTLTDQVTRVVINVGIAYGSNVERAMAILLEVAASHPRVMANPEPAVSLTGFGDSALNLELTAFAEELAARVDVRNTLNLEILRRFGEAGIEIPFPQREVHLRTGGAGAV